MLTLPVENNLRTSTQMSHLHLSLYIQTKRIINHIIVHFVLRMNVALVRSSPGQQQSFLISWECRFT